MPSLWISVTKLLPPYHGVAKAPLLKELVYSAIVSLHDLE